jgi:predicted TIM-barrel fold metal-dependent hydrolase
VNEAIAVDEANSWRLETPGARGWARSARPGAANKYFMVSADCHANEPPAYLSDRIEAEFKGRIPRMEVDAQGERWLVTEGCRPQRLRTTNADSTMAPEDKLRTAAGATAEERVRDHERDGVDVEVVFPGKGLLVWATPDPKLAMAMCRAWNRWAAEAYASHANRILPMAAVAPADREGTLREIDWAAKSGLKGLTLPCKPYWGAHDADQPNYNLPEFDWLWAAACDAGLPVTFHVSTGRDPRAARGHGGAVVNYVTHSLSPTMEPVANLCASGVLGRFPKLRFATIEAGIGWVPWALEAMDEAYKKHHMWAFPKLDLLPSEYYRRQGFSSFQEDAAGLALAEPRGLADNFLWANDYPHHEGSWPHSAEAIEREMGHLSERSRAKILGLNAARLFGLEVPA